MKFKLGDEVTKYTGDYYFQGNIVAAFTKLDGKERYVVENYDGVLHIFSESNLEITEWVRSDTNVPKTTV